MAALITKYRKEVGKQIMRQSITSRAWRLSLYAVALSIAPLAAQATDAGADDEWRFNGSLYLWGAGVEGSKASRFGAPSSDFDLSFDSVISNLNMAFMGAFEARKAKWSLLADVIYLNVGADKGANVPVPLAPGSGAAVKVDADLKVKVWLLNLIAGYNVWDTERGTLDAVAGARYADVKLDFGVGINALGLSPRIDLSPSTSVWDAVIGVKGHVDLNQRWFVPYYLDVGTGESDFTWQALAGLGYRFDWGDVSLTYRHIDWRFGSDSEIEDFRLSGPLLAATFHF